ncbi:MAG: M48 family metallopeptidase [Burkholderiaceae bacterium]
MSSPLVFSLIFSIALLAGLLLKLWLATRQIRHVAQHRDAVPAAFTQTMPLSAHQKAADYTVTKARFGLLELALGTALLLGWSLLGGLDVLNQALLGAMGVGMAQQLALLLAFVLIGGLLDLPFTLYQTFVIEEKFGFNKTTFKLWLADMVKGIAVGLVLGLPLAALVLWLMAAGGALWWLYAWGAMVGWQLLMMWLAPAYILPLFNKFTPLEDASLKDRVAALMARAGFTAKGFFVMDGSKRSAHSNAFFTGFGSNKRVVFFDTLLAKLSHEEMEAVLAHELGHFKHKHIVKRMAVSFVMTLAGFALLGWLSAQTWFYVGLGTQPSLTAPNHALALLLFMLAIPVFTVFMTPISAQFSRRDEFQADAYAVAQTGTQHLGRALLKLYQDNASTLTPDPLFVKFYYSHPSAAERLAKMTSQVPA